MSRRPDDAAGPRWHEWLIVGSIVALAVIGFAASWGGSIQRWIDDGGERGEPRPGATSGAGSPRL